MRVQSVGLGRLFVWAAFFSPRARQKSSSLESHPDAHECSPGLQRGTQGDGMQKRCKGLHRSEVMLRCIKHALFLLPYLEIEQMIQRVTLFRSRKPSHATWASVQYVLREGDCIPRPEGPSESAVANITSDNNRKTL